MDGVQFDNDATYGVYMLFKKKMKWFEVTIPIY